MGITFKSVIAQGNFLKGSVTVFIFIDSSLLNVGKGVIISRFIADHLNNEPAITLTTKYREPTNKSVRGEQLGKRSAPSHQHCALKRSNLYSTFLGFEPYLGWKCSVVIVSI
jgi:hypothetical protein